MSMGSPIFSSDIITEIISRLPVKFLLRFRCVSKPWCSLIDSNEFVKQHLKQSVVTKTNLNLILGFERSFFSISIDSVRTGLVSLDRLAPPPNVFSGLVVLNSCNGLSLIQIQKGQVPQLCIWNPFTRKYRELPVTPIECPVKLEHIKNSLIVNERYAFAYVSETDDYKVVKVVEFRKIDSFWLGSEAKIFSSRSNEWERIEDFPYELGYKRVWGAHLNGILHTVVETGSPVWYIMGFDVRSEKHAIVPHPELGAREGVGVAVDVLGGCLCLIKQTLFDLISDVWIMKDYGVKDSWFKLMSIARKSFVFDLIPFGYKGFLQPLSYSKNGEEVILKEIDQLYWYNLRTGTVSLTVNMDSQFYTELCFESLVSFPGFINVEKSHEEG